MRDATAYRMEVSRLAELELAVTRQQNEIADFFKRTGFVESLNISNTYLANQPLYVVLVFGKNLNKWDILSKVPLIKSLTGTIAKWDQYFIPLESPTYRDSTVITKNTTQRKTETGVANYL